MNNFVPERYAIERMGAVKGRQRFFKLFINEKCQIDEFEVEIKATTTYYSECETLVSYMNEYSNGNRIPPKKFKILKTPNNTPFTCVEFKSKHIRYYGFMFPENGDMIICGAEKNDKSEQNADIDRMIGIGKEYLKYLKLL